MRQSGTDSLPHRDGRGASNPPAAYDDDPTGPHPVLQIPRVHRRSRNARKVRILRSALLTCLSVLGLMLVVGAVYTSALRARIAALGEQAEGQERALALAQEELEALRRERDEMVRNRNPGLQPLEYDRAVAINEGYVRNLIFTLTGRGAETTQEYRIVLHNGGLSPLRPDVQVLLFDERGVQVGMSDVLRDDPGPDSGEAVWLDGGETRSYSATVPLLLDQPPRYFTVVVH